jgi:hypothetical protein
VSHHLSDRRLEPNVFEEFRGQGLRFYGVEEILAWMTCGGKVEKEEGGNVSILCVEGVNIRKIVQAKKTSHIV